MAFNINAKVILSGPANIKTVRRTIESGLTGINVPVSLIISRTAISDLSAFNKNVGLLTSNLQQLTLAADKSTTALASLTKVTQSLQTNTIKVDAATKTVNNSLKKVGKQAKETGSEIEKFGKDSALAVRRFAAFTIATTAVFGFVRAVQLGIKEAISFQREMARIVQVTGASRQEMQGLNRTVDNLSTSFGLNANKLLEVSRIFAQTGQSLSQVEQSLKAVAKASLAPTFGDIERTTEGAIASLSQFNIEASKLEGVLGSLNAVSKKFAVESDDLISVIRRAGGVFAASTEHLGAPGERLRELISIFTAVRSTTRESADNIATGLRTIFTRIQRPTTIKFLEQFSIQLRATTEDAKKFGIVKGEFVGVFEAFRRISSEINNLDSLSLSKVVEELGGIRQVGKLIPALKNFGKAERARQIALEGTKSLTKDVAIVTATLSVKIEQLTARFAKLTRDIAQSEFFQNLARFAIGTANAFVTLADSLRPILPLLTAVAGVKLVGSIFDFGKGFSSEFKRGGGVSGSGKAAGSLLTGGDTADAGGKAGDRQAQNQVAANTTALSKNTTKMNTLNTTLGKISPILTGLVSASKTASDKITTLISALQAMPQAMASASGALGVTSAIRNTGSVGGKSRGNGLPKAGKGGMVRGPSHADGGVVAELEGGELIVAKDKVKNLMSGVLKQNPYNVHIIPQPDIFGGFTLKNDKEGRRDILTRGNLVSKGSDEDKNLRRIIASNPKYQPDDENFYINRVGISGSDKGNITAYTIAGGGTLKKDFEKELTALSERSVKGLINTFVKDSEAIKDLGLSDIGTLDIPLSKQLNEPNLRDRSMANILKAAQPSIEGYALEGIIAATTNADVQGGTESFDIKNFTDTVRKKMGQLFGEVGPLPDSLKYGEVKRDLFEKDKTKKFAKKIAGSIGFDQVADAKKKQVSIKEARFGGLIDGDRHSGNMARVAISNGEKYFSPEVAKGNLSLLHQANAGLNIGSQLDGLGTTIKGLGTGTSDSIKTRIPTDSFILNAADSKRVSASRGGQIKLGAGGQAKRTNFAEGGSPSKKANIGSLAEGAGKAGVVLGVIAALGVDLGAFGGIINTLTLPLLLMGSIATKNAEENDKLAKSAENASAALDDISEATVDVAKKQESAIPISKEKKDFLKKDKIAIRSKKELENAKRFKDVDIVKASRGTERAKALATIAPLKDRGARFVNVRNAAVGRLSAARDKRDKSIANTNVGLSNAKSKVNKAISSGASEDVVQAELKSYGDLLGKALKKSASDQKEYADVLKNVSPTISKAESAIDGLKVKIRKLGDAANEDFKNKIDAAGKKYDDRLRAAFNKNDSAQANRSAAISRLNDPKLRRRRSSINDRLKTSKLERVKRVRGRVGFGGDRIGFVKRGLTRLKSIPERSPTLKLGSSVGSKLTPALGKLTKGLASFKGGGIAAAVALASGPIIDKIFSKKTETDSGASGFSDGQGGQATAQAAGGVKGGVSGIATGAFIGSFLGPIGTIAGASIGLVAGAAIGAFEAFKDQAKFEEIVKLGAASTAAGNALDVLAEKGDRNVLALNAVIESSNALAKQFITSVAAINDISSNSGKTFFGDNVIGGIADGVSSTSAAFNAGGFGLAGNAFLSSGLGLGILGKSQLDLIDPNIRKDAQDSVDTSFARGARNTTADSISSSFKAVSDENLKKAEEAYFKLGDSIVSSIPLDDLTDLAALGENATFDDLASSLKNASDGSLEFNKKLKAFNALQKTRITKAAKTLSTNLDSTAGEDQSKKNLFSSGKFASAAFINGFEKNSSFKDASKNAGDAFLSSLEDGKAKGTKGNVKDFVRNIEDLQNLVSSAASGDKGAQFRLDELEKVVGGGSGTLGQAVNEYSNMIKAVEDGNAAVSQNAAHERLLADAAKAAALGIDALGSAIQKLGSGVSSAIGDFSTSQSNINSEVARIFSGDQSIKAAQRTNVFSNGSEGRSIGELRAGVERVRSGIGGDDAQFKDLASTVQLGSVLPQALKDTIEEIKRNKGSDNRISQEDFTEKLEQKIPNFGELSETLKKQFRESIRTSFEGSRQGKGGSKIGVGAIDEALRTGDTGKLVELGEQAGVALEAVTNQLNGFNAAILESANVSIQVSKERASLELKSFSRINSIDDRFAKFENRDTNLIPETKARLEARLRLQLGAGGAGAAASPIGANATSAQALLARRSELEAERRRLLNSAGENVRVNTKDPSAPLSDEQSSEIKKQTDALANVSSALDGTNKAIKSLSGDMTELSSIEKQLASIQSQKLTARQRQASLFGQLANAKTPEERARIQEESNRAGVAAFKLLNNISLSAQETAAVSADLLQGKDQSLIAKLFNFDEKAIEESLKNATIRNTNAFAGNSLQDLITRISFREPEQSETDSLLSRKDKIVKNKNSLDAAVFEQNSKLVQDQQVLFREELDATKDKLGLVADSFELLRVKMDAVQETVDKRTAQLDKANKERIAKNDAANTEAKSRTVDPNERRIIHPDRKGEARFNIPLSAVDSGVTQGPTINVFVKKSSDDSIVVTKDGKFSTAASFANGGLVMGPSHAGGGVQVELEGGEYIIPKKDVSAGIPKFQDGGFVGDFTNSLRGNKDFLDYQKSLEANDKNRQRELAIQNKKRRKLSKQHSDRRNDRKARDERFFEEFLLPKNQPSQIEKDHLKRQAQSRDLNPLTKEQIRIHELNRGSSERRERGSTRIFGDNKVLNNLVKLRQSSKGLGIGKFSLPTHNNVNVQENAKLDNRDSERIASFSVEEKNRKEIREENARKARRRRENPNRASLFDTAPTPKNLLKGFDPKKNFQASEKIRLAKKQREDEASQKRVAANIAAEKQNAIKVSEKRDASSFSLGGKSTDTSLLSNKSNAQLSETFNVGGKFGVQPSVSTKQQTAQTAQTAQGKQALPVDAKRNAPAFGSIKDKVKQDQRKATEEARKRRISNSPQSRLLQGFRQNRENTFRRFRENKARVLGTGDRQQGLLNQYRDNRNRVLGVNDTPSLPTAVSASGVNNSVTAAQQQQNAVTQQRTNTATTNTTAPTQQGAAPNQMAGLEAFVKVIETSKFAEQLASAAQTLSTLPQMTIQLEARVGPIEVVLNGASIMAQFGDKVKSEIYLQVANQIKDLAPNIDGSQNDPRLA